MRIKFIAPLIVGFVVILWGMYGCAKNPDTGKWEPDYPTIAEATKGLSQSLSYEGLKWFYQNKPEEVEPTYTDLMTVRGLIGMYADGDVTVSEVAGSAVNIFERIKDRFDIKDNFITAFATGAVATLSGTLNIVVAALPAEAAMVLTGLADGIDAGILQFDAWRAAQMPPPAVM